MKSRTGTNCKFLLVVGTSMGRRSASAETPALLCTQGARADGRLGKADFICVARAVLGEYGGVRKLGRTNTCSNHRQQGCVSLASALGREGRCGRVHSRRPGTGHALEPYEVMGWTK